MTENLTTAQILGLVASNGALPPQWWDWESAIESAVENSSAGDAADAARFLEHLQPGRTWSAAEYHGLMYHHFTGRWSSAAEIGYIRANEMFTDAMEEAGGDEGKEDWAKRVFAERTVSDEDAEKFIRSMIGTYVFGSIDGSVLTFDGIFGGIIDTEELY